MCYNEVMVKRGLILGGILATVSGVFVSNVFAESANTDFNIKVNPSLSLSVSSSNVGFSLTPTQAGSYDSASFNIYSSTNNIAGYTLTMSTNKVDLESNIVNPNTGTKPTIPTLVETQNGITASAFEASTSSDVLNHWGISVAGANYNAMKSTQEIRKTTVNNTTEDTTAISLASKLDLLTVPGVYSTTINFELVANIYTKGGSIDENGRYPANSLLRAFEIAYTEAGKPMYIEDANTDIGWRPMVGSDYDTVGGKEVRFAIQDITMTFEENGQTKNVCEWAQASTTDSSYIDVAEVMDLRDGTSYHIVKAADNRCWLADNLALDPTDVLTASRINSTNTNAADNAIYNYLNGGNPDNMPTWSSRAVGGSDNSGYTYPAIIASIKNEISSDSMDQAGLWKRGVYYNYCAVSVGTFCGNSLSGKDNTAIDIENDICPAGWRLPTGGNTPENGGETYGGEYAKLYAAFSNASDQPTTFRTTLHISLPGYWWCGNDYCLTNNRFFGWTSTYNGAYTMYKMFVANEGGGNSADSVGASDRKDFSSVRCVAK